MLNSNSAGGKRAGFPVLDSPFVLAPLAGITDGSFRYICRRHGAGLTYTEMISAKGLFYKNKNTEDLYHIRPREGPVGVQLFGSDPDMFRYACRSLKDNPCVLIDINMGCPVPKVVKNGEGSALLTKPEQAAGVVAACAETAGRPVTVKMRIGFNGTEDEMPAADFARAMEDAGASAIAVHGRTRAQYYSGKADWKTIREVRRAVSIPVIGNGDIFSAEDAVRMMDETGCSIVMLARGALGNPWLFDECNALLRGERVPAHPDTEEVVAAVKEHIALAIEEKGEYPAVREMRKHVSWYLKGIKGAARVRAEVNACDTAEQLFEAVESIIKR